MSRDRATSFTDSDSRPGGAARLLLRSLATLAVLMVGLGDGSHNSMVRNAIKLGEGHITIQPRGYLDAPANHKYLANGS
ncbi:MAG: hypothetical protein K0B16_01735 [Burkholderiaceae bacterium]|nr:hypothetical protein [Burkholderiaceae bacterium]